MRADKLKLCYGIFLATFRKDHIFDIWNLSICNFAYFQFGFKWHDLVLIEPGPGHSLLFTYYKHHPSVINNEKSAHFTSLCTFSALLASDLLYFIHMEKC